MEFNVLDSLNASMMRPVSLSVCLSVGLSLLFVFVHTQLSASSQESVKVPFELSSGTANECQFIFNVKVFNIPQTLRGTLTYMVKVIHYINMSITYACD